VHLNLVAAVVRAEDLVDVDDLDALLERKLHAWNEDWSVNRLCDDALELARADHLLQLRHLKGIGAL